MKYKLVINAFDEGEGSDVGTAEIGAEQTTTASESSEGVANPGTGTEERKPFDEVIKDYKDEYTKDFQKKWDARHKDYMTNKTQLKEQGKLIERIALKYGIEDITDLKAIGDAMQADDDLIASRAMQNGLSVEQQRKLDDVELENRRYRAEREQMQRDANARRQFETWDNESKNLKAVFPDFDINVELANPEFTDALLKGIPVERAYYMIHGAEIAAKSMEYTAQAVRKATEDEMTSRSTRPRENGISRQASAKVSTNVHNLTRQERAEIAKRSMKGEKVYL